MILYINNRTSVDNTPDNIDTLKDYCVNFEVHKNMIFISEQKIVLNEINMNTLYTEVLFEYDVECGNYGGRGCEFSLNLINKR